MRLVFLKLVCRSYFEQKLGLYRWRVVEKAENILVEMKYANELRTGQSGPAYRSCEGREDIYPALRKALETI
jgi:hypothetical protein